MSRTSLVVPALVAVACWGCADRPSDADPDGDLQGVFVDSVVQGLQYVTGETRALTDAEGTFRYADGATVAFAVGDIALGEAVGAAILSPLDLVVGASGVRDPHVVNLARFLLTIDDDGEPSNGVQITEAVRSLAEGQSLPFDQPTEDFATDPDVLAVVESLTSATSAGMRPLVPADFASVHLRETLGLPNDDLPGDDVVLPDNPQALPLCLESVATVEAWDALDPAVDFQGSPNNLANFVVKGLHYGCAAQLRYRYQDRLRPNGTCCQGSDTVGLAALPESYATPQTIFPQDGDGQRVFFDVTAPLVGTFGPCYPGDSQFPNDYCTQAFYDGLEPRASRYGGTVVYRVSSPEGDFETSPWVVDGIFNISQSRFGDGKPHSFVFRRVSSNCGLANRCEFEVFFPRDDEGNPLLDRDVQVLFMVTGLLEDLPETENVSNWNSGIAVPLLIKQRRE